MYENLFSEQTHRRTTNPTNPADYRPEIWKLGNHGRAVDMDLDSVTRELEAQRDLLDDDTLDLLDAARRVRDRASLYDFECPNEHCRIAHSHDDTKHDIREKFNVTEAFVDAMEMTPFCHCGANELAMLVDYYHDFRVDVFTDQSDLTPSERDARIEAIREAAESARLHENTRQYIESLRANVKATRDLAYERDTGFRFGTAHDAPADATLPADTDDDDDLFEVSGPDDTADWGDADDSGLDPDEVDNRPFGDDPDDDDDDDDGSFFGSIS